MKTVFTTFCLVLLVTGCATTQGYPDRSENFEAELTALSDYFKPETIAACNTQTLENEKRACRDNIIFARLRATDIHFNKFQQAVTRESIQLNVGIDWAVLGLGGAGAVITNTNTQAILAAISGGITGAKGSIDKHVFYEKTMPVLLTNMIALRKQVLANNIYPGLALSTADYPLIKALNDVDDYYNAGTIPGAIIGITATAGASIKKAEEKILSLTIQTPDETEAVRTLQAVWVKLFRDLKAGQLAAKSAILRKALQNLGVDAPAADKDVLDRLHRLSQEREKTAVEILKAMKDAGYPEL